MTLIDFGLALFIVPGFFLTLLAYFALNKVPKRPVSLQQHAANPNARPNLPFISICIAARNEEGTLPRCLQALEQLTYDPNKMEILIGNDSSSDHTLAVAQEWAQRFEHARVFHIGPEFKSQTQGKARVLSYLIQQARGDYYLITDADCQVSADWAHTLVAYHLEGFDCVTGSTSVTYNNIFSMIQALDWRYFMSLVHGFGAIGVPITAVGNNMSVCAKVYHSVGGYETIPFSVTEDFKLFSSLLSMGASFTGIIEPGSKVRTLPQPTLKSYLIQRKRWLTGAMGLKWPSRLMLAGLPAWYLGMGALTCFAPWTFVASLALLRLVWVYGHQKKVSELIKETPFSPLQTLIYEASMYILIPLTLLYYCLPGKVVWKGRKH